VKGLETTVLSVVDPDRFDDVVVVVVVVVTSTSCNAYMGSRPKATEVSLFNLSWCMDCCLCPARNIRRQPCV